MMLWWAVALSLVVPGGARIPLQVQSWTATSNYKSKASLARDVKLIPSASCCLLLSGGVAPENTVVSTSHSAAELSETGGASSDVVRSAETAPTAALDTIPDSNEQPNDTVTLSDPLDSELLERIQAEPKLTRLLTVVGRIPALRNAAAVDVLVRVERAEPEDCLLAAAALVRLASLAQQARYNTSSSTSGSVMSGDTLRDQVVRDRRFEQCTEVLECRADCLGPRVVFQVLDSLSKLRYRPPRLVAALRAQSLAILAEVPAANSSTSGVSRVSDAAWLLYAFAYAEQTLGVDATAVAAASKKVLSEYSPAQLAAALPPATLVNFAWAMGVTQSTAADGGGAVGDAARLSLVGDGIRSNGNGTDSTPGAITEMDLAGRVFAALLTWLEPDSPLGAGSTAEVTISHTAGTPTLPPGSASASAPSTSNAGTATRMLSAQDCAHAAWAVRSMRQPNGKPILAALAKHSEAQLALTAATAPTTSTTEIAAQGSESVKATAKGLAAASAAAASVLSERRALAEFAWAMAKSGVRPSARWQHLAVAHLRPAIRLSSACTTASSASTASSVGEQGMAGPTDVSTVAVLPLPVLDVARVGWALTWFGDNDGLAAEIVRAAFAHLEHQPLQQGLGSVKNSDGVQPLLEDTDAAVNLLWATAQLCLRDQASTSSTSSSVASREIGGRRSGGGYFAFECAAPLGRLTAALQAHVQQLSFSQVVHVVESCGVLSLAPERLLQSAERRLARAATASSSSLARASASQGSCATRQAAAAGQNKLNAETNVAPGNAGVSSADVAAAKSSSFVVEEMLSLHQAATVAHAFSSLGYQAPHLFVSLARFAMSNAAQFEAVDLAVLFSALARAGHSFGPLPFSLPVTSPATPPPVAKPSSAAPLDHELNHSLSVNSIASIAPPGAPSLSHQEAGSTQPPLLLPLLKEAALRELSPSLATQLHWALATKLMVPQKLLASSQLTDSNDDTAPTSSDVAALTAARALDQAYSELFARLQADLALKLVLLGPRELVDTATSLAALATRWPTTLSLPHANALMDRIARCLVPQPMQPASSSSSSDAPFVSSSTADGADSSSSTSGHSSAMVAAAWPPARFSSLQLARLASAFAHVAGRGLSDDDDEGTEPLRVSTPSSIAAARNTGGDTGTDRHGDIHAEVHDIRALSEAQTMAVKALHAEAGKRLKELSSNRADVFFAGNCQQWCQLCLD